MGNKNYTNYNKNSKPTEAEIEAAEVTNEVEEAATEAEIETVEVTNEVEEAVTEPVQEAPTAEKKFGVVCDCTKLNVRNQPVATAGIVTTIPNGQKVKITEDDPTSDFYAVSVRLSKTENIVGYCMKKFISVK